MRHSDLVILGLLSHAPRHGYDLVRDIETMRVRNWARVGPSTVYRSVQRLETQGYLRSAAERAGRRPERRVYEITGKGRRRLIDLVRKALASEEPLYSDRLVGGIFATAAVESEKAAALLGGTRERLHQTQARLASTLRAGASPWGEAILRFYEKVVSAEEELVADLIQVHGEHSRSDVATSPAQAEE